MTGLLCSCGRSGGHAGEHGLDGEGPGNCDLIEYASGFFIFYAIYCPYYAM